VRGLLRRRLTEAEEANIVETVTSGQESTQGSWARIASRLLSRRLWILFHSCFHGVLFAASFWCRLTPENRRLKLLFSEDSIFYIENPKGSVKH
jgi:hypothetical protein